VARALTPAWARRLRPHRGSLVAAAALSLVTAAVPGGLVLGLQPALRAVEAGDTPQALRGAAALVALVLVGGLARVVRTALTKRVSWAVAAQLRRELHGRWLSDRSPPAVGDQLASLTDEADQVQYGVAAVVTWLRDPLTLLGLAVAAAWSVPRLLPLAAVAVPLLWAAGRLASRWVRRAASEQRAARSALAGLAGEQLLGAELIAVFGARERERGRFAEAVERDRASRVRTDVLRLLPSLITELVVVAAVGALLVGGAAGVASGWVDVPGLVAFVAAVALAQRPLVRLGEAASLASRAGAALERVEQVLAEPEVQPPAPSVRAGVRAIRLQGACWAPRGVPVVGPMDLTVDAGEVVALVGSTGAGKTSVLRLMAGLVAPTAGTVVVGDDALHDWPEASRAQVVSWVPQDGFTFARSLLDNLRLGAPELSTERGEQLLAQAHARYLADHDEGIGRRLGRGGAPLSGGERQRLALARALATGAGVLLLDEPTNQVDPATEAALLDSLDQLRGQRTVVVATHDLGVARRADRVVVIEQGRVVEQGPADELLAGGGAFAALAGRG
jgi:ABC-type multidrug transport system fused ATPase/permease subunit